MLALLAAVPAETAQLRQQLRQPERLACGPRQLLCGQLAGQPVGLLHVGIGQTGTASALAQLLCQGEPETVLMLGCGGSYPHSGLGNGDLALATSEIFGDLGVATAESFCPLAELNLPLPEESPPLLQQQFPLASSLQRKAVQLLRPAAEKRGLQLACGPFVTVAGCSGHPALSRQLERRTGGICENMEGAAAAQVCQEYRIPFLELRGISNPTGTRDTAAWELKKGMASAQWGLLQLLESWPELREELCNT